MSENKQLTEFKKAGINTNDPNFKKWVKEGLLDTIDLNFASEVSEYWKDKYEKDVDVSLHIAFLNYLNKKEVRLIPGKVMQREILPVFNDYNMSTMYGDKNLYDIIINPPRPAKTILRNVRGFYFDGNHNGIISDKAIEILCSTDRDLIIKPSKTNNGNGVRKISIKQGEIFEANQSISFDQLISLYKRDFLVQEVIDQHSIMANPHPSSVNTIRLVTFRWKGEIRLLLAFARFGNNNDIRDNGHVDVSPCLGINDKGEFKNIAFSKSGKTFTHHPTTGFDFSKMPAIPNFDEFKEFAFASHKNILHLNFISWDIAMGSDGKPVFIEGNFAGSTSFYQMAAQQPMFGDITEEVLSFVKEEMQKNPPPLMKKHRKKIEKKKRLNEQQQLITLEKSLKNKEKLISVQAEKLESLEKELSMLKKKNEYLYNSKSYKLTQPLRKLVRMFKKRN